MNFKKKHPKRRNQCWLTLITFSLMILVFAASLYAESWTVGLTAESGDSIVEVSFGVAKDATDDYDFDYDVGLPPPSPEKMPLSMSFENELTPLETDIRGPVTSGQQITWTLNIDSDEPGKLLWNTEERATGWSLTIEGSDMRTVGEMSFDQGRSTMTVTAGGGTITYNVSLQEGINLISVPLDPGEKDGQPWRLSELLDFIGSDATMIIRYDKDDKKFVTYMPNFPKTSPANTVVQGGEGYIVVMSEPASVIFMGTTWDGKISLAAGINVISVPLNPSAEEWRLSDLMSFIGKDATMVISYDKVSKKFVNHMPTFPKTSPSNKVVQGGEGYIVMMKAPADVVFTGTAWENTITASPPLMTSTLNRKVTPFFVVEGFVSQKETGATLNNVKVAVNNLNNGLSNFSVTGMVADDGQYVVTLADFLQNRAAQVGDVIEVVAKESKGAFGKESVRYTIKENDILSGKASLGNLPMLLIPKINALLQNYPNPFNPETWIPFALAENAEVMIRIYDLKGRLVRKLNLGRLSAGIYDSKRKAAYWDGRNHQGEQAASGVYIYQMIADMKTFTRRMVILK